MGHGVSSVHEMVTKARVKGVVGAIRSDSGLGMVGRSGRHWCAGIDRGAGSRPGTPGCGSTGSPSTVGDGARRAGGGGWSWLGMCSVGRVNVFSFGADVSTFRANVSSFWADVFSFEGDVSTLAGDVSSFWRGALVGDGARTDGAIPRVRCAALGMTAAAGAVRSGCRRGRGDRLRWD